MKRIALLFAVGMALAFAATLHAADHIVFIHGWQLTSNPNVDTWDNMVDYMTNSAYGTPFCAPDKILVVQHGALDAPIAEIAVEVWNQILRGFPDGTCPAKMDFVVHSMGGLVLRSMVDQGLLSDSRIGRVVTLGTPHYGQRQNWSRQMKDMEYGSSFVWRLATTPNVISPGKVLCVAGTRDCVVEEWSAAMPDELCAGVRFVPKDHMAAGDFLLQDGICECGDGRNDVVYRLVTRFLRDGVIADGQPQGSKNKGAILFQVQDARGKPVEYEAGFWPSFVSIVQEESGERFSTEAYSPQESFPVGVGSVVKSHFQYGLSPQNYTLHFQESKDKVFSGFVSEPIRVRRGRTTVVPIFAESVKPMDFLFLIDTTGSMGDDIASVKDAAQLLIRQKLGNGARNCRVAIADYRDYPVSPYGMAEDYTFKLRCDFTTNMTTAISALNGLLLGNGLDEEESVLTALYSSIRTLNWNPLAKKTIMLMGDAGPHDPEPWAGGHSSGEVLELAREAGISVYPMCTGYSSAALSAFAFLAEETGGKSLSSASYTSAAAAVQEIIEQTVSANGFETEIVTVKETTGSATLRIFGGSSSSAASIDYQVIDGSARNGADYSLPSRTGRITWSAGERGYKTITIPILINAGSSADTFFTVSLANPVGMGLGGINLCRVNVLDSRSIGLTPTAGVYIQGVPRQIGAGSVAGSGSYALGATAVLTAQAASGYVFTSWEDGSTSPRRVIDATSAKAVAVDGVATYVASFMRMSELPVPEIISSDTATGKVGEPFNWRLEYYSPTEVTLACSTLPAGFKFVDGCLSGTMQTVGSCSVTFTVSNARGAATKTVCFSFESNPVLSGREGMLTRAVLNGADRIVIPQGAEAIGSSAFAACGGALKEVTIPRGVTQIGDGAFRGCSGLKSIELPATVQTIGRGVFAECTGLLSVRMPRYLQVQVNDETFAGCSPLLEVTYYDTFRVRFDAQGGDLDVPVVQVYGAGEPLGNMPVASAPRWICLGWFTDPLEGERVDSETAVETDSVFYAHWEQNMTDVNLGFYCPSEWQQAFFLSDRPDGAEHVPTFEQGDAIYLKCGFMNTASFAAVEHIRTHFTLNTGARTEYVHENLPSNTYGVFGDTDSDRPSMLQNLPPGRYTLTCSLDVDGAVEESDEMDNERTISFEVCPANRPNLIIPKASVSKVKIGRSESVVLHWRVENVGLAAAKKCDTTVRYGTKIASVSCLPLAAGAGREYSLALSGATLGLGTHDIFLTADGKYSLKEQSETDNAARVTVIVTSATTTSSSSAVDWQFKKVNAKEPDSFYLSTSANSKKKATTFKVGQRIYLRCGFWNYLRGAASGDMRAEVALNGGSGIYAERSYFARNTFFYFTDRAPGFLQDLPAGKYTLTATLDSTENWRERNEKNNVRRISFTVVERPVIYSEATYCCALNESVNWPVSAEGTVTSSKLPSGLKYQGGAIVGKATKLGTYLVKFTAKNAAGTTVKTLRIVVSNPGFNVTFRARTDGAMSGTEQIVEDGGSVSFCTGVRQSFHVSSDPGKAGVSKSSASSVAVSGLPSGLSYAKGVISGVPRVSGRFNVKLTFKNKLGWSKTFKIRMVVDPIPLWAKGTFAGAVIGVCDNMIPALATNGLVTSSIGSSGKISGKFTDRGTNWTFSASAYARRIEGWTDHGEWTTNFTFTAPATYSYKYTTGTGSRKKTVTKSIRRNFDFTIMPSISGGELWALSEDADGQSATYLIAGQSVMGQPPWKSMGKALFYASAKMPYRSFTLRAADAAPTGVILAPRASLSFKITPTGTVTVTGAFPTGIFVKGKDSKKTTETIYRPTCTTILRPMISPFELDAGMQFAGSIFVYFAPSPKNNFPGFVATIVWPWP